MRLVRDYSHTKLAPQEEFCLYFSTEELISLLHTLDSGQSTEASRNLSILLDGECEEVTFEDYKFDNQEGCGYNE